MKGKTRLEYEMEGLRRMQIRKRIRFNKWLVKIAIKQRPGCPICGEDSYCYCGDGTPYSY